MLAVVEAPNNVAATSNSGKLDRTAAATARTAPTIPVRYAVTRPTRRPRAAMRRAAGTDSRADPRTCAVLARPARSGEPRICSAIRLATAMPLETPTPPNI